MEERKKYGEFTKYIETLRETVREHGHQIVTDFKLRETTFKIRVTPKVSKRWAENTNQTVYDIPEIAIVGITGNEVSGDLKKLWSWMDQNS